jgi:hypothetical protein
MIVLIIIKLVNANSSRQKERLRESIIFEFLNKISGG